MKKLIKILSLMTLAGSAAILQAATFDYTDMVDYSALARLTAGGGSASRSGTFNILAGGSGGNVITVSSTLSGGGTSHYGDAGTTYTDKDGFDPTKQHATSGFVSFYFRDDNDAGGETYRIQLDLGTAFDSGAGGSMLINRSITFEQIAANANILASINADGKLDYKVTAVSGDFFFDYARLDVNAVPDGGLTVALLGLALTGVEGLRRKMRR